MSARVIAIGMPLASFVMNAGTAEARGAWLGVMFHTDAQTPGPPVIGEVFPDTAADKAGLKSGDKLLTWEGKPVRSVDAFIRTVGKCSPGKTYALEVERDGFPLAFSVTLAERPKDAKRPARLFVGKRAPELAVTDWLGEGPYAVAPGPGKPRIIEFWATWCGPCKLARPKLAAAQRRLGPKGLEVLAISTEPAEVQTLYLAAEGPVPYRFGKDEGRRSTGRFAVQSFPTIFLVDAEGIVRSVALGVHELDGLLTEAARLVGTPPAP